MLQVLIVTTLIPHTTRPRHCLSFLAGTTHQERVKNDEAVMKKT